MVLVNGESAIDVKRVPQLSLWSRRMIILLIVNILLILKSDMISIW